MEKKSMGDISLKTIIKNIEEYNKKNKSGNYKEDEKNIFNLINNWVSLNTKSKKNSSYYESGLKYGDIESALKNFFEKMYDNRVSRFFSFLFWSDFKSKYKDMKNDNLETILKKFAEANLSPKSTMNKDNTENLASICNIYSKHDVAQNQKEIKEDVANKQDKSKTQNSDILEQSKNMLNNAIEKLKPYSTFSTFKKNEDEISEAKSCIMEIATEVKDFLFKNFKSYDDIYEETCKLNSLIQDQKKNIEEINVMTIAIDFSGILNGIVNKIKEIKK